KLVEGELDTNNNKLKDLNEQLEKIENENKEKLNDIQSKLDGLKEKNKDVMKKHDIWEYFLSKMESPEIEIVGIISSRDGITQDELKQRTKSVSPVFLGRALTKLESDGKITDNDGKWVLSSSLKGQIQ
ncbi:MAG: hypothetical protein OEY49_19530, partial [Candidatus Heimdallarchaeota archaeon]|nr:hypothetical protein [Candidatus Heimdallarchaeota archaeon]